MTSPAPAIQIENLSYTYGRNEAVHDLSLTVQPGRCYGLFGRNGAGKTTTMKCLLNLLRPQSGKVSVFGLDPTKHEVDVKRLLSYVPDQVAFYPWMTVRETLDYLASFRENWNRKIEQELLERFRLDATQRAANLRSLCACTPMVVSRHRCFGPTNMHPWLPPPQGKTSSRILRRFAHHGDRSAICVSGPRAQAKRDFCLSPASSPHNETILG